MTPTIAEVITAFSRVAPKCAHNKAVAHQLHEMGFNPSEAVDGINAAISAGVVVHDGAGMLTIAMEKMKMTSKLDPNRIAELKDSGYTVESVFDGDPELFGWFHASSGASQGDWKTRQPYRTSKAQAWNDCDAYVRGCMPIQAEPDWKTQG